MADPISAGIMLAGTAASMYAQNQAANAQEEAYKMRREQERIAAMNRSIQRQHSLNQVLSTQQAMAGSRGIVSSGGSFQAIQQGAFHQFDSDERADALTTSYNDKYLQTESNIARANANINMTASLFNTGNRLYNINSSYR